MNKLITFYAFDNDIKMRVKKLSGILQYKKVELQEIKKLAQKSYEKIYSLLENYQEKGLIEIKNNVMEYTIDGVFWGNSITASIVEEMIKDNK